MIPFAEVGVAVADPLAGWETIVSEAVLTAAAPPLTSVRASNWLGGDVVPGVYPAKPSVIVGPPEATAGAAPTTPTAATAVNETTPIATIRVRRPEIACIDRTGSTLPRPAQPSSPRGPPTRRDVRPTER